MHQEKNNLFHPFWIQKLNENEFIVVMKILREDYTQVLRQRMNNTYPKLMIRQRIRRRIRFINTMSDKLRKTHDQDQEAVLTVHRLHKGMVGGTGCGWPRPNSHYWTTTPLLIGQLLGTLYLLEMNDTLDLHLTLTCPPRHYEKQSFGWVLYTVHEYLLLF